MIKANFRTYGTYVTDSLYQWDLNQILDIHGLNLETAPEVHFSNADIARAIVRQSEFNGHVVSVKIPNSLLQSPLTIKAHVGIYENDMFKVVELVEIPIVPRKKPADYQIENTDEEIYSFNALLNALSNKADNARVDNIIAHNNDTDGNTELLDARHGANGIVYATVGSAMREQIGIINSQLNNERLEFLIPPTVQADLVSKSDTSNWVSNKLYKHGKIKHVSVYILGDTAQTCTITIYTDNGDGTATRFSEYASSGVGAIDIPVNTYIPNDFYVGIKCVNCAFGTFSDGDYWSGTFGNDSTIIVPVNKTKYYHAYTLRMECVMDEVARKHDVSENYVKLFEHTLTGEYLENSDYKTVIDLPNNRIYKIRESVPNTFGLPSEAIGNNCTLFKYMPGATSAGNAGFCVYELTILRHWATIKYYAYAIIDQTVETLVWRRYNATSVNKTIKDVGLSPLNIVLIGDSIVEGYGSSDYNSSGVAIPNQVKDANRNVGTLCWANTFAAYMMEQYDNCTVVNNGIGGFTCQQIFENLDTLVPNGTNVVILSVGTNDRNKSDKSYSITGYIRKILMYLIERSIQPILLTNTPLMNVSAPNNAGTVKSAIVKAGDDCDVVCCDVFGQFNNYLWEHDLSLSDVMADDLHPNDLGYNIIYHIVRKELGV